VQARNQGASRCKRSLLRNCGSFRCFCCWRWHNVQGGNNNNQASTNSADDIIHAMICLRALLEVALFLFLVISAELRAPCVEMLLERLPTEGATARRISGLFSTGYLGVRQSLQPVRGHHCYIVVIATYGSVPNRHVIGSFGCSPIQVSFTGWSNAWSATNHWPRPRTNTFSDNFLVSRPRRNIHARNLVSGQSVRQKWAAPQALPQPALTAHKHTKGDAGKSRWQWNSR